MEKISYLGVVGGMTVKDTTRRILKALIANSLAVQFNFHGHGVKHAFGPLTLREVVNGMHAFLCLPDLTFHCYPTPAV